ncbi:MAG: aminotransferase class I/II-fold pyridoxal phosphate-dependent enzyme, partial [Elusimicrobia bacterium]|nr:aminotransferase class I/II-fold pyridoxal phosphate-dependent enzyme [Elusimicrobiota bacterium]
MKVPFVDLSRQHNAIRGEIVSAIDTAIQQSHFILSGEVAAFEKQFAEYCGTKYCVGISSGTDALQLALRAVSAGSGDSVIVPANTFISTALAVAYTGARPVFVDVEENTYNIDLQKVREAMQKQKIKAIIPVHLYGQPCNMAGLLGIANEYKVDIIEDACQSHGAECLVDKNWIKSGTIGRAGCFSFYPGKNLGALGDAGAVVTNDKSIAEEVYALRDLGQKKKSEHTMLG